MRAKLDIVEYQRELNRVLVDSDEKTESLSIRIYIGQETYHVDASVVSHIDQVREITPLPGTQPWVLGATSTNGRVVIAVDPSLMRTGKPTQNGLLIVLKNSDMALVGVIDQRPDDNGAKRLEMEFLAKESVFVFTH